MSGMFQIALEISNSFVRLIMNYLHGLKSKPRLKIMRSQNLATLGLTTNGGSYKVGNATFRTESAVLCDAVG